tara:strand:- start:440 stop:712 length:273 start_codon:yes stop_codon:yes gene_type:complete
MSWRSKRNRMLLTKVGYGHWRVSILSAPPVNQKVIKSCVTTNSTAVDDFMSDESEYEGRYLRVKSGTEELWGEVQRKHQLYRKLSNTNKQ